MNMRTRFPFQSSIYPFFCCVVRSGQIFITSKGGGPKEVFALRFNRDAPMVGLQSNLVSVEH